jgi:hypothetical protein
MKKIPLTQGKFAMVDDTDYEYLMQWKWCLSARGYAVRKTDSRIQTMHRLLLPTSEVVDHINRNRLDNRRCNLRGVTYTENAWNASVRSDNSSGHPGVSWSKQKRKWRSRIKAYGKDIHLGFYDSQEQASAAP